MSIEKMTESMLEYGRDWTDEPLRLWDRFEVDYRDLPTLQTLLQSCDKDILIDIIQKERLHEDERLLPEGLSNFRRCLSEMIVDMCGLDLRIQFDDREWLLLPIETFSVNPLDGSLRRRIEAPRVLIRANDISPFAWGVRADCGYRSESWEKVLSYRVWMGGSLCGRERYMMLASAVWEMIHLRMELGMCTPPIPFVAARGGRDRNYGQDYWGLAVEEDFERRYLETLQETADWLNEKAWQRFTEERTFFIQEMLKSA